MATNIANSILEKSRALPEGGILSPKEFLHLGSRGAIDMAFIRLMNEKKLFRIGWGLYTAPVRWRFGVRFPACNALLAALSAKTGETIVVHGAMAANQIGLSMQVPVREIHLTSGACRKIRLNKAVIELRHAPAWQLLLGNSLEGKLIRALACFGPQYAKELFPNLKAWKEWRAWPEVNWQTLSEVSAALPSWLAKVINEMAYA
jgi:hypothetical protein